MDRRPSRDDQRHADHHAENPNVFDDDYAANLSDEDDYAPVSDGFRPSTTTTTTTTNQPPAVHRQSVDSSQVRRSISAAKGPESQHQQHEPPRRSSIAKPPLPAASSSFAMANEGPRDPFADPPSEPSSKQRPVNAAQALMHRASVASTSSFATTGGRSQSPAGPSHPYGMYPQGTGVARSSSVTTTSTYRDPQGSVSGERPQHPYGMYPQNPVDDGEDGEPSVPRQAIPVGFPGLNNGYHRQIGPDGEEQDIIGPDGHTEQLPPYSRYPEEGPTKASLAATTTSPVASPLETPQAVNNSQDTLAQAPPPPPVPAPALAPTPASAPASVPAPPATSATASPVVLMPHIQQTPSAQESQQTEKSWKEKNWTEKRRTRVLCGRVPLWLVILLVGLLVLFAIILGAAIGSMLSKAKDNKHNKDKPGPEDPQAQVTATPTLFDAKNIPAPSNAAQVVVVGTYGVPLDQPEETQRNCITDTQQSQAWSCNVNGPPTLLNVVLSGLGDGSYVGWLQAQAGSYDDDSLQYGVRPPTIPKQPMQFVKDGDEPSRGPALHFQTLYDKVVVLPESFVSSKSKRDHRNDTNRATGGREAFKMPDSFRHRNQVQPGEFPWICRWNATFIEAFIYIDQNSTFAPSSTTSATPSATPFGYGQTSSPTTTRPPSTTIALVNGVVQTTSATVASNYVMPRYDLAPLNHYRRGSGSMQQQIYPRVVKVEERRIPMSQPAVCEQMQINDDGSVVPRRGADGIPIIQTLSETDPSMSDFMKAFDSGSHSSKREDLITRLKSRDDPEKACHCQWIVQ